MNIFELFILAIGLSMDAFAVSVCKGLSLGRINAKHMCIAGAWFGGFQALMPTLGWLAGGALYSPINQWDHWIAFALLVFVSFSMVREAFEKDEDESGECECRAMGSDIAWGKLAILAVATSLDALAVGFSFAMISLPIACRLRLSVWFVPS